MGYKRTDKCIAKAFDDERLFVLMARDEYAPFAIIEWIKHSLHKQPLSQLIEALTCAHAMANREGPDLRARIYEAKVLAEREKYLREKAADPNELRPSTYGAKEALDDFRSNFFGRSADIKAQATRLTDLPFGTDREKAIVNEKGPETCTSCGKQVNTLFDGLCSECHPI